MPSMYQIDRSRLDRFDVTLQTLYVEYRSTVGDCFLLDIKDGVHVTPF